MRPFALQHRGLASRPIPVTASMFPVYIFETTLRSDPTRSVPHSRPRRSFVTWRGTIRTRHPLPDPISGLMIRLQISAPLQDLSIPRDHSLDLTCASQSLPLQVARFAFPPRSAVTIFVITRRYGSSVQIRYFLPGSLSFEPLGTRLMMLPIWFAVNDKIVLSSGNNRFRMCGLGCD
jgi:hypothetical protein